VLTFGVSSTRISFHVNAPRSIVYRALLDCARGRDVDGADRHDQPRACVRRPRGWIVPDLAHVRRADGTGKTTAHTDTHHGRFVKLVTNGRLSKWSSSRRRIPRCAAR